MIEIPKQLQKDDFKFFLLKSKSKESIPGIAWSNTNYQYNKKNLLESLKTGNNYGIIGGCV